MKISRYTLSSVIWFIILLAAWEAASRSGIISPLILPNVENTLLAFFTNLVSGNLAAGTAVSLLFVLSGISAGIIVSVLLASLSFQFKLIRSLGNLLTAVFHPLPGIALMPLFILFFGIGRLTVLMVILHSVLWPLFINISAGFNSVPELYKKIGYNYGFSRTQFFFRIMVPAAFPHIFAGLRTAWARAWRAAISAEMLFGITGSGGGLGWYIFSRRVFMDTQGMYAGIIMLALIGLLVESVLFRQIELRTLVKWGMSEK